MRRYLGILTATAIWAITTATGARAETQAIVEIFPATCNNPASNLWAFEERTTVTTSQGTSLAGTASHVIIHQCFSSASVCNSARSAASSIATQIDIPNGSPTYSTSHIGKWVDSCFQLNQ